MPIEFGEIVSRPRLDLPEDRKRIEKLIDETFEIKEVYILESKFREGKYAIIVAKQEEHEFWFTTSSEVLLRQLEEIKRVIEEKNDTVKVTLRKVKKYYTFE